MPIEQKPIVNSDKYVGKYVTFEDFGTQKIITSGRDPIAVYRRAQKKGFKSPVLFFVPASDTVHVY